MKYDDYKMCNNDGTQDVEEFLSMIPPGADTFNIYSITQIILNIAGETDFNMLIKKIMIIIMECIHANRGVFLINENDKYVVKLDMIRIREKMIYREPVPLQDFCNSAYKSIKKCIDLKAPVYIRDNRCLINDKRIICVPGILDEKVQVVVYLETGSERVGNYKLDYLIFFFSLLLASVKRRKADDNIILRLKKAEQELIEKKEQLRNVLKSKKEYGEQKHAFFQEKCKEYNISPREKETIELLIKGYLYKEINSKLNVSINTIKARIKKIYRKCNVQNKVELINVFMPGQD